MTEESTLEIQPIKFRSLLAGCKTYTIRRRHRAFAKSIRISNPASPITVSGIVNSYVHSILSEVPLRVLEAEGWRSFQEALDALRVYYPELDWNSEVTIVEFRLAF
jgi:hypothetical protein